MSKEIVLKRLNNYNSLPEEVSFSRREFEILQGLKSPFVKTHEGLEVHEIIPFARKRGICFFHCIKGNPFETCVKDCLKMLPESPVSSFKKTFKIMRTSYAFSYAQALYENLTENQGRK